MKKGAEKTKKELDKADAVRDAAQGWFQKTGRNQATNHCKITAVGRSNVFEIGTKDRKSLNQKQKSGGAGEIRTPDTQFRKMTRHYVGRGFSMT